MPPTTQYFSRLPKALYLNHAAPQFSSVAGFESPGTVRNCVYSTTGKNFAYATQSLVKIVNPDNGQQLVELEIPDVVELKFSPRDSYLMTWERPKKEPDSGNFAPNLKIWDTKTGEFLASFVQKTQSGWGLQFSFDEKFCALMVKNEVVFYECPNFSTNWSTLSVEGCTDFSLSPGQNYSVAVFVAEKQGRPASVRVYQVPSFSQPVSQKTFFKAERVQLKWNKLGTALLALASTEVDQSGKSYYGETNLYLLGIAGSYDSRIQLDKQGPIYDFEWSPNSREFGVVYGFMPAKTTIFDARGNIVHSLPPAPRNTILFSPHGRFLLQAGFGNLQGTVNIYDRQKQFAPVSTIEASNTSLCEWSPDGRYILTATTSPRLRVDNGIKIWHYTGALIFAQEHDELFAAGWRPQDVSLFPIRASISPPPSPHTSVANIKTKAIVSAKPSGAYRPPHARSAGVVSAAPTSLFQKELASQSIPDPVISKAASKNKKKRDAARKAKAVTDNSGESDSAVESSTNGSFKGLEPPGLAPSTNSQPSETADASSWVQPANPEDRRIRSLLKKLRAIEELKQKMNSGQKLEVLQLQKISTEPTVRKELTSLGWSES